MKIVKLLYNPNAGKEEYAKEHLVSLIVSCGFECRHSSTIEAFETAREEDLDFVIVAGGDGTIRQITKELIRVKSLKEFPPIALLPIGTANNVSKTLGIMGELSEIIASWHNGRLKNYDIGILSEPGGGGFFLESFGFGIFPYLMMEMAHVDDNPSGSRDEKMQTALELLHRILLSYDARDCRLDIDGKDHSGKFFMAEVMNTRSIGPNLFLAPHGDPGDGFLEVVLVPEEDKEKFISYVWNKLNGVEGTYVFHTIRATEVTISWQGTHVHIDDEVVKLEKAAPVTITIKQGLLEFLVP